MRRAVTGLAAALLVLALFSISGELELDRAISDRSGSQHGANISRCSVLETASGINGAALLHVSLVSESGLPFDSQIYIYDGPGQDPITYFETSNGEGEVSLNSSRMYAVFVWTRAYFYIKKLFLPPEGAHLTFATTNETVGKLVFYSHNASGTITGGVIYIGVDPWTMTPFYTFYAMNNWPGMDTPLTFYVTPMVFHLSFAVWPQEPHWLWGFLGTEDVNISAGQTLELHVGGPTTVLLETRKDGATTDKFSLADNVEVSFRVIDSYGNLLDYVAEYEVQDPNVHKAQDPNLVVLDPNSIVVVNVTDSYNPRSNWALFQPAVLGKYNCTVTWDTGPLQGIIKETIFFNTFLTADLNLDGIVNILDITVVAIAFKSKPGDPNWNQTADLNKDGVTDIIDITMVAIDFGKTVQSDRSYSGPHVCNRGCFHKGYLPFAIKT